MTGPGAARIAQVEAVLGVTLPESVRELYRESDGWYAPEGQWFVVWPLGRIVEDNLDAWNRGLPRDMLAFGDDGTGNPFCVSLDELGDAVVRWNWFDGDVEFHEGSMPEFRRNWLTSEGTPAAASPRRRPESASSLAASEKHRRLRTGGPCLAQGGERNSQVQNASVRGTCSGTMTRMGLLCDYFVAPSDADAAATIDRVGGPRGTATPPAPPRRGLFRRRSEPTGPADTGATYASVDSGGIEPVVQMGTLEELLTGRSYDEIVEARDGTEFLAMRDGGERLVVKVSDALTNALADASTDDVAAVADPWAQTEEFWGAADPAALAEFLLRLSALARQAREDRAAMYCWMSV